MFPTRQEYGGMNCAAPHFVNGNTQTFDIEKYRGSYLISQTRRGRPKTFVLPRPKISEEYGQGGLGWNGVPQEYGQGGPGWTGVPLIAASPNRKCDTTTKGKSPSPPTTPPPRSSQTAICRDTDDGSVCSGDSDDRNPSPCDDSSNGGVPLPRIIKPRRRRRKDRRPKPRDDDRLSQVGAISTRMGRLDLSTNAYTYPAVSSHSSLRRTNSDPLKEWRVRNSMAIGVGVDRRCFSCPSSFLSFYHQAWEGYLAQNMIHWSLQPRESVTASHPPQRPWIPLGQPNRSRSTCIFTVMCYNILCDKYATRQMYGYCPQWALEWDYRKKGIMNEISHYAADIISLQEVETEQFYNLILPELKRDGYEGIFSPKSRAKTMNETERKHVDGCAILWRTSKFELVKEHLIEFNQVAMANAEGSDDMLNRVMTKDNIGLAALLETKEGAWENGMPSDPGQARQPVLVVTAHIHWDPEFSDVKLIQTMMLMSEIRQIVEETNQSFRPGHRVDPNNIQLLLCGDLNSLPESGVVEFLTNGRVSADHIDFKDLGYKSSLQKLSSSEKTNEYAHPFKLARAYADGIMPYTNYTFDFKGIIDYICFSKETMTPLGLLGPLDEDWFTESKVVGCPHPHVPSDHFPLLVELEMTPLPSPPNGIIGLHR